MKKLIVLTALAIAMMIASSSVLVAQTTANGTLTVQAQLTSSMTLVFNSDGAGVPLSSGAGTNAATLNFGNVSAYGPLTANVGRSLVVGTSFTVNTPVDVVVNKANVTSANYTLTAQLGAAPAGASTWQVGGVGINNATATTITASGAYASSVQEQIAITVPWATTATSLNNTIAFVATAN